MKNREKIIIGGAAVALLYFVIDLFAVSELDAKGAPTDLSRECEEFLVRGNLTLGAVKDSPELFRRINLLESTPGGRNPFVRDWLRKEAPALAASSESEPSRSVRYTGYIESGGNCLVVINGREYSLDQMIEGTDLLVNKASKQCVVLQPKVADGSVAEAITVYKEVQDDIF